MGMICRTLRASENLRLLAFQIICFCALVLMMDQQTSTIELPLYSSLPNSASDLEHPAKWTRMLRILPGQRSSAIECNLEVVDLALNPIFEALSYVWGPQQPPHQHVQFNSHRMSVTPNLFAALRRLRRPDDERLVWIDAICVNQEDLDERSQQVLLMRDIYARAWRVIVWLGEDEGFAAEAIEMIKKVIGYLYLELGKSLGDEITIGDLEAIEAAESITEMLLPALFGRDLPWMSLSDDNPEWEPVEWFYKLQWFRRIWVVQEVAFSPALMYVGEFEVGWDIVKNAAFWLDCKGYGIAIDCRSAIGIGKAQHSKNSDRLDHLMTTTHSSEATDPRDKVFALVGLLDISSTADPLLQPDYTKDVVEVFSDALRFMAQKDHDGFFLSDLIRLIGQPPPEVDMGFPSWVPRFHIISKMPNRLHRGSRARKSRAVIARPSDKCTLVLKGTKFTTIKVVDHTLHDCPVEAGLVKNLWEATVKHLGPELTHGALDQAFIQTVTTLDTGLAKVSTEKAMSYLRSFLRGESLRQEAGVLDEHDLVVIRRAFLGQDNTLPRVEHLRVWLEKTSRAEAVESERREFWLRHLNNDYSFLITHDRKMGLGAKIAQPGDVVCIFSGADFPFLIRPAGEDYRFLGQCYVHGMMNGEGLEELEEGRLKEEWISLQ